MHDWAKSGIVLPQLWTLLVGSDLTTEPVSPFIRDAATKRGGDRAKKLQIMPVASIKQTKFQGDIDRQLTTIFYDSFWRQHL